MAMEDSGSMMSPADIAALTKGNGFAADKHCQTIRQRYSPWQQWRYHRLCWLSLRLQ